jgi:hypothetical protein
VSKLGNKSTKNQLLPPKSRDVICSKVSFADWTFSVSIFVCNIDTFFAESMVTFQKYDSFISILANEALYLSSEVLVF